MANCVNRTSPEFIELQNQSPLNPIILAAKVSLWQDVYGVDRFPTMDELSLKMDAPSPITEVEEDGDTIMTLSTEEDMSIATSFSLQTEIDLSIDQKEKFTEFLEEHQAKNHYAFKGSNLLGLFGYTSEQDMYENMPYYFEVDYTPNKDVAGLLVGPSFQKISGESSFAIAKRMVAQMDKNTLHPALMKLGITTGTITEGKQGGAYIKFNAPSKAVMAYDLPYSSKSLHPLMVNWMRLTEFLGKDITPTQAQQLNALYERATKAQTDSITEEYKKGLPKEKDGSVKPVSVFSEGAQLGLFEDVDMSITLPSNSFSEPKFSQYVEKRKKQVRKIEVSLVELYQIQKTNGKTPYITKRITYLKKIKADLEKEVSEFQGKTTLSEQFEYVRNMFKRDANRVEELFANPTAENMNLAKDILEYIAINADPKNGLNAMFKLEEGTEYYPEVLSFFGELSVIKTDLQKKYDDVSDELILNLLSPHAASLQKLYPKSFVDENDLPLGVRAALAKVRDQELKKAQEDISFLEKSLLGQDQNLFSESDILAQLTRAVYEMEAHKKQAEAAQIIQKINNILPKIERELRALGKISKGTVDYLNYMSTFYRTNDKGITEPYLVSKFTFEWENFVHSVNRATKAKIDTAIRTGNMADISKAYADKFRLLKEKTTFVDIRRLADVTAPNRTTLTGFSDAEQAAYKQELIDQIGQNEYDELVKDQQNKVDEFNQEAETITQEVLAKHGVTDIVLLPQAAQDALKLRLDLRDPYELLEQMAAKNAHFIPLTKYNTFIPKDFDDTGTPTGFYDAKFKEIENNPTLKEAWEVFQEASHLININLVDSKMTFSKNSLLWFKKDIKENFLNKSWRQMVKDISIKEMLSNTRHFILNAVSASKNIRGEEHIVLPNGIASFNDQVTATHNKNVMQIGNLMKKSLKGNPSIKLSSLSVSDKEILFEIFGVIDQAEFLKYVPLDSKGQFKISNLKILAKKSVAETQTQDLPTMLKVLLEQSALHSARSATKAKLDPIHNLNQRKLSSEEEGKLRENANQKTDFFVKSVVNNEEITQHFGKFFNREDNTVKEIYPFLDILIENLSYEEKKTYKIYKERYALLEEIKQGLEAGNLVAGTPQGEQNLKELNGVNQEMDYILRSLRMIGKDYSVSAAITNTFTTFQVTKGMAYSITSPLFNMVNARAQMLNREGEFWTPGNAFKALAFTDMRLATSISPSYKQQWAILGAIVQRMNLISDGTNEFQRGQRLGVGERPKMFGKLNVAGVKIPMPNKKLVTDPFFGTAAAEYYNQVPAFLAMAMDMTITNSVTGEEVPFFDGNGFPAFKINLDGNLGLLPEFDTEENRKHFLTFESTETALWAAQVKGAIANLNGDYANSGVIMAKSNVFAKQALAFKTWTGKFLVGRYAMNQKNLLTGETKDGYISGALSGRKTRAIAAPTLIQMLTGQAFFGAMLVAGGPASMAIGVGLTSLLTIAMAWKSNQRAIRMLQVAGHQAKFSWKPVMDAFSQFVRTNTIGMIELPVNAAYSTASLAKKMLLKNSSTSPSNTLINPELMIQNSKDLDVRDMKNMSNLVRQAVLTNYTILLVAVAMSLLGDDDEKELETNNYELWLAQRKKEKEEEKSFKQALGLGLKNSGSRIANDLAFGMDPMSTLTSFMGDKSTAMGGGLPLMDLFGNAALAQFKEEGENINTNEQSMYYGDSKIEVAARKHLLPSFFKNLGKDEWAGGFENLTQEDYNKSLWDKMMNTTDLKKDQKNFSVNKSTSMVQIKEEVTQEFLGKSFKEITDPLEEDAVEKVAKKRFELLLGSPKKSYRRYYTADQERLDTPEAQEFFKEYDKEMDK
jgi:hypothetical protein